MPERCGNTLGRGNHRNGVIALAEYPRAVPPANMAVRHILFGVVTALFIVGIGQNWSHYSGALMIAAWVKHKGDLGANVM